MKWVELDQREVKIKKERKCWGCQRLHTVGAAMILTEGIWSGEGFVRTYQCPVCQELQNHVDKDYYQDGFEIGWVLNEADNMRAIGKKKLSPELVLQELAPEKYAAILEKYHHQNTNHAKQS